MNHYNSYKDSGIEWIGDIPTDWNILKIKNLFSFAKGSGVPKSEVNDFGHSSCIVYGQLYTKYKGLNVIPNTLSRTDLSKDSSVTSMGNEILIPGSTTTTGIDLCNCKTLNYEDVILGGDIIILRPKKQKISREFYSYFISTVSKPQFEMEGRGVTIYHIYPKQIREMFVPNLPIDEQNQIVSFLDNKIEKIDYLIEKIEQKIKLLKEQKSSLIHESVTKGINPSIGMKDSGVEWIGEIPINWEILRCKYILRDKPSNGIFKKKDQFGFGTKLVNVSDIYTDNFLITDENLDLVDCDEQEKNSFKVKYGDQFFIRSSLKLEGIGVSSMYIGEEPCVFESHIVKITPNEEVIIPRFLNYYLNSTLSREYFIKFSNTVTMTTIPQDPIKNLLVPIPSKKEQEDIIEYLNKNTKKNNEIILKNKKKIELLNEYKQSLIFEVVTGKKRVVS